MTLKRKWFNILLPQMITIVLVLGVFFLCQRVFDESIGSSIYFSLASLCLIFFVAPFTKTPFISLSAGFLATSSLVFFASHVVATPNSVAGYGASILCGISALCFAEMTADNYFLSKVLVNISFLTEGAIILFTLLSFS